MNTILEKTPTLKRSQSNHIDLVFDKVFAQKKGKNSLTFNVFKDIYDLPVIEEEFNVSSDYFDYISGKDYFVTLALYDDQKRIYLLPSKSSKGWGLPGASIKNGEFWHESISKICTEIDPSLSIGEVEPVTLVYNHFKSNLDTHTHRGIGFIARIRSVKDLKRMTQNGRFLMLTDESAENISSYSNKHVARECQKRISQKKMAIQENEIATNELYKNRYVFHDRIVKKYILTEKLKRKREFQEKILECIGEASTVLDASCGDNNLIRKISQKTETQYVIGNDISWSQILLTKNSASNLLFTNHDATSLPFKDQAFDVCFCSNTLHHMPFPQHLKGILESIFRVSKRVVIVEIEKPSATGWFPHMLNKHWYIGFLKDVGGAYLEENEFHQIVLNSYPEDVANVKFDSFANIQGKYMIATIERKV